MDERHMDRPKAIMPYQLVQYTAKSSSTLYALMDFSFWFGTVNLGWSILYIKVSQVTYNFQMKLYFFLSRPFLSDQTV